MSASLCAVLLLRLLPLPDAEPSQINYFQRASALVKKHQYSAALSDLGRAMALDPKFVKGQAFRARILKLTGACDAAQAELQAILAAHPAQRSTGRGAKGQTDMHATHARGMEQQGCYGCKR